MSFTTLGQFQVFDPMSDSGFTILTPGVDGKHFVADSNVEGGWSCQDVKANIKGSFTLSAGTHTQISCPQITSDSVVSYCIASLGTVTVGQVITTAIEDGVGFTPTSADSSDTSVINWALIS